MVVGGGAGGRGGSTVGVATDVRTADGLTVAGATGTGGAVVVGIGICVDITVDSGVESVGVTIWTSGRAGWSNTMAVAVATDRVARTTPVRTNRFDQRLSSCGCAGAWGSWSSPSPVDSSASSG